MQFTVARVDPSDPCVYYLTPAGVVDIRMARDDLKDCIAAAEILKARFFIRQVDFSIAENVPVWGVFDTRDMGVGWSAQHAHVKPRHVKPRKEFCTDNLDAPVMWAITMGGLDG